MKRLAIPVALILAMVAMPALAWHGKGDCSGGPGGGPGGPDELGMAMHLLHLGETLGLSEQQKTDIQAVVDAARPQFDALREQMESGRDQWRENFDPTSFDEAEAREFAQSQAAIHADLMVLGMKTRAQIFSILTPEQQEQLRQFREEGGPCGGHHKAHHSRAHQGGGRS